MNSPTVVVTGSRGWNDPQVVEQALLDVKGGYGNAVVSHGGARGADEIAEEVCQRLSIPTTIFRADWDRYGRRAGILRNEAMFHAGADVCIGFWDGRSPGTRHSLSMAQRLRLPIVLFKTNGEMGWWHPDSGWSQAPLWYL